VDLRTDAIPALIRKIAVPATPGDQFPLPVVIVDAACAGSLSANTPTQRKPEWSV